MGPQSDLELFKARAAAVQVVITEIPDVAAALALKSSKSLCGPMDCLRVKGGQFEGGGIGHRHGQTNVKKPHKSS